MTGTYPSPYRQGSATPPARTRCVTEDPRGELRLGWLVVFAFFGLFLGWSIFAPLDAAVTAQGYVAVEGHRQTVQHKEGGVISAINVHEGQAVHAGDVLISVAPAEVAAAERSMSSQVISLQAQRARLEAEAADRSAIERPVEFSYLSGADQGEADRAMRLQQDELHARAASLSSQRAVLRERSAQLSRSIEGYTQQIASSDRQSSLIGDELRGTESLASRGYASQNRVRALQRDQAGLGGQRADYTASIARSGAQISETQMQSLSLSTQRQEDVAKDLRDTNFQLNDLLPKLKQLKEELAATEIRAPVSGQVVGLSVFTVGGVVTPGQKLLDIVPSSARLVIDAQLPASRFDGVYIEQPAEVKVSSMHERNLPIIHGKVTEVSGDSLADEKTGARYYNVEVTVPESEAAEIRQLRGPHGGLRAGLPVEVVLPIRKRTAFEYLTEPLTQVFHTGMHER